MTQDEAKALVGRRAAEMVEDGMAVGLGTGTTSVKFIQALGERVKAGLKIRCVASSDASGALGRSLGMDVVSLAELPELDVYIDGADEVGPGLALIKGGGGALLREKIVASSAKKFIVVADSTKVVKVLGAFPLPVEVIKMALPLVEKNYNVKLTKDPEGRATMGGSSGGSAALEMAWYHPDLYHRVLTYSGTYVNQQWPYNSETPHGAWGFHETLISNSPVKPLRIWMEVGDRDNFNPNAMRDRMHDWVVANEEMAKVLAAKGYHYQFVFAQNAGHVDRATKMQTLPEALEYVWQGYRATK